MTAYGKDEQNTTATMTLGDLQAKRKAYRQFQVVPVMAFFGLLGAAGIVTVFVAKRIDKVGLDAPCIAVLAVTYALIAALMYYVMGAIPRRRLLQLGLTCPTCGARLLGRSNQQVTATGHCGSCGTRVLEEVNR
jgi:DNA-directed RNA polymerase subunit RPC12/RpoP